LRPCDENLAFQLEEGYLKAKPFRYPQAAEKPSSRPSSLKPGDDPRSLANSGAFGRNRSESSGQVTPKSSAENLKQPARDDKLNSPKDSPSHQPQTHRLFGTYMNSVVTYQDSTVAVRAFSLPILSSHTCCLFHHFYCHPRLPTIRGVLTVF